MTYRFPDLEIYLMKPDAGAVRDWLARQLGDHIEDQRVVPGHCHWRVTLDGHVMDVFLNDKAEKNFASLWFKQNHSPWNTDLECARSAHAALGIEVRCSDSGWQENVDDSAGGWIKLIRNEEKPVHW